MKNQVNKKNQINQINQINQKNQRITRFIPHLVVAVSAVAVIIMMAVSLKNWEKRADTVDNIILNKTTIDPAALVESEDYYTYMDKAFLTQAYSDGQLTILILGDESVGEFGSGKTIAAHVEEDLKKAGINSRIDSFAFPQIHFSPFYSLVNPNLADNDLSMYEIIKSLSEKDFSRQKNVLETADFQLDYNNQNRAVYKNLIEKLSAVDMDEVDVLVISTGIADYLAGVAIADVSNLAAINTHSGAVNASALLIMEKWPRIRLIVMSPPYFRTDAFGKDEGADTASNGIGRIGDYMTAEKYVAVDSNFSYLDNLFGSGINEQNYRKYLEKDMRFPNELGREMIAQRLSDLLIKDYELSRSD